MEEHNHSDQEKEKWQESPTRFQKQDKLSNRHGSEVESWQGRGNCLLHGGLDVCGADPVDRG